MGTRRLAREHALQILYQWDLRRDDLNSTIATFWEVHKAGEDGGDFSERLVRGTVEHLDSIDSLIVSHAKNWRLDRMETLDRNLLRMAVEELLFEKDTPSSVVMNEAMVKELFPHTDHLDLLAQQNASVFIGVIGHAEKLKKAIDKRTPEKPTDEKSA